MKSATKKHIQRLAEVQRKPGTPRFTWRDCMPKHGADLLHPLVCARVCRQAQALEHLAGIHQARHAFPVFGGSMPFTSGNAATSE